MLIDQAKIYVLGGRGGKGCQSLYRDIFHRRGFPDGGDGGDGGDIIIESDPNLNTLLDFKYNQHHKAHKGINGGSNRKIGKKGKDCLIRVPVGTIVTDSSSGLVIRDFVRAGDTLIAAKGGTGGRGNSGGRTASEGDDGESKTLLLELKMVADAGIIGFPNAGKSTLVSRISRSHSKIAPYPFTTKSPKLGVVSFYDKTFVVADMPGLIEGAHSGKGLGDRFLRHIERTSVLVHIVDASPADGSDPADNFRKLEEELKLYDEKVYNKPRVIALNKIDITDGSAAAEEFRKKIGIKAHGISALSGEGLDGLIAAIYEEIKNVSKKNKEDHDKDRYTGLD
ncbi:MAG: Obg family GTPase CgtA [Candidatus Omnitrophota bacterium]|nr:GTPase ObgE [Candidatus Omnitrophota bacterium]